MSNIECMNENSPIFVSPSLHHQYNIVSVQYNRDTNHILTSIIADTTHEDCHHATICSHVQLW